MVYLSILLDLSYTDSGYNYIYNILVVVIIILLYLSSTDSCYNYIIIFISTVSCYNYIIFTEK